MDLQFDEQTDKDLVKLTKKLIVVDRKERMKISMEYIRIDYGAILNKLNKLEFVALTILNNK